MSNQDKISKAQANLPLPEDPPRASDWNSADARTVNVGAGGVSTSGEALKNSDPSQAGREAHDNLGGLPNDAVTREAKHKAGLANTTNKDYNYPKNDPSSGLK